MYFGCTGKQKAQAKWEPHWRGWKVRVGPAYDQPMTSPRGTASQTGRGAPRGGVALPVASKITLRRTCRHGGAGGGEPRMAHPSTRLLAGCIRSCRGTSPVLASRMGHIEQPHGFSPVWVRSCGATALLLRNRLGHIEQAYGFSPVWVRSCEARWPVLLKRFGHIEQA